MKSRALAACILLALWPVVSLAQTPDDFLKGLKWREIGPFRGGRSCAVSGVPGQPDVFYMGSTGGGVWKSTNAGVDWANVSDGFFNSSSVGAIEVSPSQPNTVYVGMGETEIRGNISAGDGVYRSDDAGKTWRHLGLESTQSISRVRIHPSNPDIVWVAALGHVYGPHPDRGVYKSTDGGKSWRKVLFVDNRSGAVDLTVDPNNPDVMIAATWEAWRTPYSLNSGGPGSRLFKSTDGGETWREITYANGLPAGLRGKMGVAISPANSQRVYVMIESAQGGLYKSDDGGTNWTLANNSAGPRQRPWYYTRVTADPKSADTVYILNVAMHKSTDGGKTNRSMVAMHSDHHDLWIDPADPNRMISGNDGGGAVTVNGGQTWTDQDFATAQMYHVSTDNAFPYRVLGAQQDNSTVRIPSRTFGRGIREEDWTSTAGGESGYVVAKPNDPDIVLGGSYGGDLSWQNHRTGLFRSIDPWPDNPMGAGAIDLTMRFQWTFPIVFSPHDPNVVYTCSQFVLRSDNLGQSWTRISGDLSRNDPKTLQSSGGPITKDNTSVEYYGTVFTLAESPKAKGLLWAGSDDGLVHITADGGRNWRRLTIPGMPEWGLVSMIDASATSADRAWIAVDNHENDDHRPYIYRTDDRGKTFRLLTKGIPANAFVRVVREDPVNPNLVFAGTEIGIYVSTDGGANWRSCRANLPLTPIHDLVIKDNDVVVATHGRSFWILDDISALRQMSGIDLTRPTLFVPATGLAVNYGFSPAGNEPIGKNPLSGFIIDYWLPAEANSVSAEIIDREGTVVATVSGAQVSGKQGLNRLAVTPRYPSYTGFPGMLFWAAGPGPIKAPPGIYTIKLTVDGRTLTTSATWAKDPRTPATDADLVEQFRFSREIAMRITEANQAVVQIRDYRTKLQAEPSGGQEADRIRDDKIKRLTEIEEAIYQTKARSGQDLLNYPIRLNNKLASLLGGVQSGQFAPTAQSREVYKILSDQLQVQLNRLREIIPRSPAELRAAG